LCRKNTTHHTKGVTDWLSSRELSLTLVPLHGLCDCMGSTTSSALVASQAGPPDGSPLSTEAILMPSKARQLADDIRGAVASLPSHLDPLCQAIAAKGGPKPPPGLLHSSVSLKPQLAHDPCLCATAALIQGTHLPAQMAGLICSLSFVFAHYISSPSCTQGCSVPRRFLFLIDSCSS